MFCKYTSLIICWIILKVTLCLHFPINEKSYLWQFFKTYCLFVGLHSTRIETLLQNLTYAWNSVRVYFSVAHLQWSMVISEICETRTCCRALVSGTVTTYFNDLGLARLGIESRSPAFEANAIPLSHRGGLFNI